MHVTYRCGHAYPVEIERIPSTAADSHAGVLGCCPECVSRREHELELRNPALALVARLNMTYHSRARSQFSRRTARRVAEEAGLTAVSDDVWATAGGLEIRFGRWGRAIGFAINAQGR